MDKKILLLLTALLCGSLFSYGQSKTDSLTQFIPQWSLKTNLLYDATATFNLGAEFRTGEKQSLEIPINYNPFTFSNGRKWKHFLVQPEYRWWKKEAFDGHFLGLHAHYGIYNVGALPSWFSENMQNNRYEGWLVGGGISYGYRWNFSNAWGLEATIGVGYAYLNHDKYPCIKCGRKLGNRERHYVGPTKVGLSVTYTLGKTKTKTLPPPPPVYVAPEIKPEPYTPQLKTSFVVPEVEEIKRRSESGKAYLDYVVNKSVIDPQFKNNAAELQRIYDMITEVQDDPDATITQFEIIGYASPDGRASYNQELSEKRAEGLRKHLSQKLGYTNGLFAVSGVGEDWGTFAQLMQDFSISQKDAILSIIDSADDVDLKERKLAALGAPYKRLKDEIFTKLRRTDYELHYTVLPFTIEKGKEVLKTKPSSLSLNELFLIANTYEMGSPEFNEVFETAARLFPNDDTANLNAAASALRRGDKESAANYLSKVKETSAAFYNNRAVLNGLLGEWGEAAADLEQARRAGDPEAAANIEELNKRQE